MHQVCLSKTGTSIYKERIVHLPRSFGDCDSGCVGKTVVFAYDKGIEGIARVESRLLKRKSGFRRNLLLRFLLLCLVGCPQPVLTRLLGRDIFQLVLHTRHLRNRDLQLDGILLLNILDCHLSVRDKDADRVSLNLKDGQRLQPCLERDVRDFIFLMDILQNVRPFFFNNFHKK